MRIPNRRQIEQWAGAASYPFTSRNFQWLEKLNPANVIYYRWLFLAAYHTQPNLAVELGVCRAQASAHIAAGGAKITVGVDIAPWKPTFDENVALMGEHGLDYRFIEGHSTAPETVHQIAEIVKRVGPIEFLFIDTIHTYNQAWGEFLTYRALLAPGALVVMDDILDPPNEVYRAFEQIPGIHIEMPELHIAGRGSVGFGAIIYQQGGGN